MDEVIKRRYSQSKYQRVQLFQKNRRTKSQNIIKANDQNTTYGRDRGSIQTFIQITIKNANLRCEEHDKKFNSAKKNYPQSINSSGVWSFVQILDKRSIKGSKALLKWNPKNSIVNIYLRVVFSDTYNNMTSDDIFVELNSANIKFSLSELKKIQNQIDQMLEEEKKNEKCDLLSAFNTRQFNWLKTILVQMHTKFLSRSLQSQQTLKKDEQFPRREINFNYMPFPAQVCLSWSPHHEFCLIEQRLNYYPRPVIGAMNGIKNLIQKPNRNQRFQRKALEQQQIKSYQQKEQELQADILNFYDWDMNEEVNLAIFKSQNYQNQKRAQQNIVERSSVNTSERNRSKTQAQQVIKHEISVCQNLSNISLKTLLIFKKNFSLSKGFQFPRQVKIKVYASNNMVQKLQDNITYLVNRIKTYQKCQIDLVNVILKNQMKAYPELLKLKLDKKNHKYIQFRALQYKLITKIINKQIAQQPNYKQSLCLKAIILENEYFHSALEEYFRTNFKRIKTKPIDDSASTLGSYMHFDDQKAESIFMQLLQRFLKGSSVDNQYQNSEKNSRNYAIKMKNQYITNAQKYDNPLQWLEKQQNSYKSNQEGKSYSLEFNSEKIREVRLQELKKSENGNQPWHKRLSKNPNLNNIPCYIFQKLELYPMKFELIIPKKQRTNLFNILIPALSMNNHKKQSMQQIIFKKALVTNSKIVNFLNSLNFLIKKFNDGQFQELKTALKVYKQSQIKIVKEHKEFKSHTKRFVGYCAGCDSSMKVENLIEFTQLDTAGGWVFQEPIQELNSPLINCENKESNNILTCNQSIKYCVQCRASKN